jgi:hypothetical protein
MAGIADTALPPAQFLPIMRAGGTLTRRLASRALIVGGGSAGCVLAARLSEDARNRVVLVEAGRNITLEAMPDTMRTRYPGRAFVDPDNIWGPLTAYMGAPLGNADNRSPRRYEQARVLGGGSAINAMVANRGAPGDVGSIDAEGCLRVLDRRKDMINRGGYKVYSIEVENVLMSHADVIEAAVVARPCPVLGERAHAIVCLKHAGITSEDPACHCARSLADYKVPAASACASTRCPATPTVRSSNASCATRCSPASRAPDLSAEPWGPRDLPIIYLSEFCPSANQRGETLKSRSTIFT